MADIKRSALVGAYRWALKGQAAMIPEDKRIETFGKIALLLENVIVLEYVGEEDDDA